MPPEQSIRLSQLRSGQHGIILRHEASDLELLLLEMGCLPGEPVRVEMIAPLGDPIAILIAGYQLSIRKADAARIWVSLS